MITTLLRFSDTAHRLHLHGRRSSLDSNFCGIKKAQRSAAGPLRHQWTPFSYREDVGVVVSVIEKVVMTGHRLDGASSIAGKSALHGFSSRMSSLY